MSLHLASVEESCPATVYMLSLSLLPTINLNRPSFPLFSSHFPYKTASNQSGAENSGKERAALHIRFAASSADMEKEACGECFWMDRGSWYVHLLNCVSDGMNASVDRVGVSGNLNH